MPVQGNESTPKIVISSSEVATVVVPSNVLEPTKLQRLIPIWGRLVMLPLVLVLPVLALVALVLRFALRPLPPRTQQAWHSYLMALLIAGAFFFTASSVLFFSYMPTPPQSFSAGLSDLDERANFPSLPIMERMTGVAVAKELKPLVMVASPMSKRWFGRGLVASGYIGAAVLLHADSDGFLFATAGHVAAGDSSGSRGSAARVLLTTGTSGWASSQVIAWHRTADLALLWIPRHQGSSEFVQPLVSSKDLEVGAEVFAIGHPEGLNFTISNGIISRLGSDILQISAPVSPGNSGGPVYDDHGNLLGIVIAKMNRSVDPNAENLNFAATADLLSRSGGWDFIGDGAQHFAGYVNALQRPATTIINSK